MIALRAYLQVALLLLVIPASVSAATTVQCKKPSIRREWRALSKSERADWIKAVNCLGTLPHSPNLKPAVNPNIATPVNTSSSLYDDLVYMHMDTGRLILHNGYVFPWHRWFLQGFENLLKEKCGYKGVTPYWDWRIDAADPLNASIWDPDPESGLGGSGDPNNDIEVQDGGFGSQTSTFRVSYPYPHPIRRRVLAQPFVNISVNQPTQAQFYSNPALFVNSTLTYQSIQNIVQGSVGDYVGFTVALEGFEAPLYCGHGLVGGDMIGQVCPSYAPKTCTPSTGPVANDPIFWLHHAMIDKVWNEWQNAHPQNFKAFHAGSVQALANVTYFNEWPSGAPPLLTTNATMPTEGFDPIFPQATIEDLFDIKGGLLCYQYE